MTHEFELENTSPAEEPVWFFITSIGRAASYWLAWSLSQHPDIVCSHGDHYIPRYIDVSRYQSFYDIPETETGDTEGSEGKRISDILLSDYLDLHQQYGEAKVYGNVHGCILSTLIQRIQSEKLQRKIVVANLIRNPVDQIISFDKRHRFDASRSNDYLAMRMSRLQGHTDIVAKVQSKFDIDFENHNNLLFMSAVAETAILQKDILNDRFIHVPSELITGSRQAFSSFFSIFQKYSDLTIEESYLDRVFAGGRMNYSTKESVPSAQAFEALQEWQQYAIRICLSDDVVDRYVELGYDLSYFRTDKT